MITIPVSLSSEDFADLCDTAGYGIGYWAESASIGEDSYTVQHEEGTSKITLGGMIQVIAEVIAGKYQISKALRFAVITAFTTGDLGDLDSSDADALVQLACFQEIVYG